MDQMTDSEIDQQRHFHSEPYIAFRGTRTSQHNICTVTNIDSHYVLDAYDNFRMYGVTQYAVVQHQYNLDMGVASSSIGVLPLPLNHRASNQLTGSSAVDASGAYGRKTPERVRGNYQYFDASASSSVALPNARLTDGVVIMDSELYSLPQYRANSIPSPVEVGPIGSSQSRSGESIVMHGHNHFIQGNYLGQHFQPATPPRLRQQLNNNSNGGHTMAPATPPRLRRQLNNNSDVHTTAWNQSLRRPHGRVMAETNLGPRNQAPMGFLQVDDAALLVDHQRDVQLDIEDMSYEELLELGEQIGNASTGLTEETITAQMKTKEYLIPATANNLEEGASEEQEIGTCIICQDEYKNGEKIAILQCTHEYHADCLRKWLLVKNVCPLCKSEAVEH